MRVGSSPSARWWRRLYSHSVASRRGKSRKRVPLLVPLRAAPRRGRNGRFEDAGALMVTGGSARSFSWCDLHMLTDAQALAAVKRNPDAICALYDRYGTTLVRFLIGAGASREAAWDVTQETFARLLVRGYRGALTPGQSAWPWLSVTSRNLLRDWQRRGRADERARQKVGARTVDAGDEL